MVNICRSPLFFVNPSKKGERKRLADWLWLSFYFSPTTATKLVSTSLETYIFFLPSTPTLNLLLATLSSAMKSTTGFSSIVFAGCPPLYLFWSSFAEQISSRVSWHHREGNLTGITSKKYCTTAVDIHMKTVNDTRAFLPSMEMIRIHNLKTDNQEYKIQRVQTKQKVRRRKNRVKTNKIKIMKSANDTYASKVVSKCQKQLLS